MPEDDSYEKIRRDMLEGKITPDQAETRITVLEREQKKRQKSIAESKSVKTVELSVEALEKIQDEIGDLEEKKRKLLAEIDELQVKKRRINAKIDEDMTTLKALQTEIKNNVQRQLNESKLAEIVKLYELKKKIKEMAKQGWKYNEKTGDFYK